MALVQKPLVPPQLAADHNDACKLHVVSQISSQLQLVRGVGIRTTNAWVLSLTGMWCIAPHGTSQSQPSSCHSLTCACALPFAGLPHPRRRRRRRMRWTCNPFTSKAGKAMEQPRACFQHAAGVLCRYQRISQRRLHPTHLLCPTGIQASLGGSKPPWRLLGRGRARL